ncbi:MAG: DNA primase [SAR202 cluster bacterium Io17-Chloro-G7]|nr:MAG: DNA primase [SAR202 cluster bacterium Io17-Chloro-G7]
MTVVDDIKGRLDILEVVSQHVPLQKSGRSYKANCPFHQEKTPSFHVFPDRQSWRCFGACATGGDIFSFVMRAENLEFGDALKRLSEQSGVPLPSRQGRSQQQASLEINEAAREYFQRMLASAQGAEARAYLERRGLTRSVIESFELGFSPQDGESLKRALVDQKHTVQELAQAGLVHVNESGWARDLFRGRLMFPIRNNSGELTGFGGRALKDATPKYLNTPRTPAFDKGRILYGLHLAKKQANEKGLVVVEGYMDVIAAHQHGYDNAVASMGTALTEYQVDAIRRLTSKIVMALDADAAGQQATLRSLESSWRVFQTSVAGRSNGTTIFQQQTVLELKVAVLPSGKDPDDLIRASSGDWSHLIENATPFLDYLLSALSAQLDTSTPQGKAKLVDVMFPLIAAVPEPTQQDQYFQSLAAHLGVTQETLKATIGRPLPVRQTRGPRSQGQSPAQSQRRGATASPFAKMDRDPLEDFCLALLLQNRELKKQLEDIRPEYFRRLENREIFSQLARATGAEADEPETGSPNSIQNHLELDEELSEHVGTLASKSLPAMDQRGVLSALRDVIRRLEERHLRELKAEEEIRFTDSPSELLEDVHQGILEVNERLRQNQGRRNSLNQDASILH